MAELVEEEKKNDVKKRSGIRAKTVIGLAVFIIFMGVVIFFANKLQLNENKANANILGTRSQEVMADFQKTNSQAKPDIEEDEAQKIASFIQEKVNTGGYNGCSARRVGNQLVQVDMKFPAGTDRSTVEANTSGVADHFAQVGRLASTIHYAGYSGSLKVCEYQYDMFRGTVKKIE